MTVFQDLVKVYDHNQAQAGKFEQDHFGKEFTLLPTSHVSVGVQLEVTIDLHGNFKNASVVGKDENTTVIPATIKSANRSSSPEAHPLQDKIKYVAGDYGQYMPTDKKAAIYRTSYMTLLGEWAVSSQKHSRIVAIYQYQQKNCLLGDLIHKGLIVPNDKGQLSAKDKNLYVRFNVYDDNPRVLWQDQSVFQAWIDFYATKLVVEQPVEIDYLTGDTVPTTKLSEKNINPATSGAKLISANDSSNFTYRGLFLDDEFYSVGYEASQKMAHALKWLIQRQGLKSDTRVFLFWTDGSEENKKVAASASMIFNGPLSFLKSAVKEKKSKVAPETGVSIAKSYNERLLGMVSHLTTTESVHMMFLDAATTGRMATVYYNFMASDTFKKNLQVWGENCGIVIDKRVWTPTANQLVRSAYMQGAGGQRFDTVKKHATSRLLIAIMSAQPVSGDLILAIYRKLLRPQGYRTQGQLDLKRWQNDLYNFSAVLNYNQKGGSAGMTLNQNETDRSYLFGRLLAIADAIETQSFSSRQYQNDSVTSRLTTAKRFITNFAEQPALTWQRIFQSMNRSYLKHLTEASRTYFDLQMEQIMSDFKDGDYTDAPLKPNYLKGYADQRIFDRYHNSKKQAAQEG
jgi:CRISPR-associated protein Csd1